MKRSEQRERTITETVTVEVRCDLCGRVAPTPTDPVHPWASGRYDALETDVRLKTGTSYPEGGSGEEIVFDICPTCFTTKLMPWLESHGAKATTDEWSW